MVNQLILKEMEREESEEKKKLSRIKRKAAKIRQKWDEEKLKGQSHLEPSSYAQCNFPSFATLLFPLTSTFVCPQ